VFLNLLGSVKKLAEGKNFAYVATVRKDGSPQVTPVWVDHDGENLLINTSDKRAKFVNTKRDPRVAVAIADSANPYKKVVAYGKVVGYEFEGADKHIDKLAKKYLGKDKYPGKNPQERRVILKINVERVVE
jgi:PPOX class probable F420-dependent enzyme